MNKPSSNKLLILFCLVFFFCKVENARSESVVPDTAESQELYLKSLFLSGNMDVNDSSKLGILAKKPFYQSFKSRIKKHWELYNTEIGEPFTNWKKKNVPEPKSKVVFYPFSGPDFPNAYALFPKAHTYILIGLEAGGFNPEIETLNEARIANGLNVLNTSLDTISSRNYFMTNSMKVDISKSPFRGTASVFLTYLGLMKIKPFSLKNFILNSDGEIHYLTKEEISKKASYKEGEHSVEIEFVDPVDGSKKKLYFISTNISNYGFKIYPGTLKFLDKFGDFAIPMKAASYLLHYDSFTEMRDFVLKKAELFVMDDTGPRIKDIEATGNFSVKVFGRYTRPIGLWPEKVQPDLQKIHAEQKPEKIDFKYGYGTADKQQHIMVVTRKKP
jgi:hypothetical protein